MLHVLHVPTTSCVCIVPDVFCAQRKLHSCPLCHLILLPRSKQPPQPFVFKYSSFACYSLAVTDQVSHRHKTRYDCTSVHKPFNTREADCTGVKHSLNLTYFQFISECHFDLLMFFFKIFVTSHHITVKAVPAHHMKDVEQWRFVSIHS